MKLSIVGKASVFILTHIHDYNNKYNCGKEEKTLCSFIGNTYIKNKDEPVTTRNGWIIKIEGKTIPLSHLGSNQELLILGSNVDEITTHVPIIICIAHCVH